MLKIDHQKSIDKELVLRCLKHERQAQHELYHKYCDAMYSICYRITGCADDASDALQEAFIQVFTDIKQFEFKSTLGAWIKTIVVRTAIRIVKKSKQLINEDLSNLADDYNAVIPNHLEGEDLEKAILSMPKGYRTVFLLIEVEGYSHEETAEMLGISIGTSKSQLHHAKKMLRQIILKNNTFNEVYLNE